MYVTFKNCLNETHLSWIFKCKSIHHIITKMVDTSPIVKIYIYIPYCNLHSKTSVKNPVTKMCILPFRLRKSLDALKDKTKMLVSLLKISFTWLNRHKLKVALLEAFLQENCLKFMIIKVEILRYYQIIWIKWSKKTVLTLFWSGILRTTQTTRVSITYNNCSKWILDVIVLSGTSGRRWLTEYN